MLAHPLYKKDILRFKIFPVNDFVSILMLEKRILMFVLEQEESHLPLLHKENSFAHDIRSHALQELQKRAQRGIIKYNKIPSKPDIIIIDAPCSGTGRRLESQLYVGNSSIGIHFPLFRTKIIKSIKTTRFKRAIGLCNLLFVGRGK